MRSMKLALLTLLASLLASSADAGLILTIIEIDSGDPDDELVVSLQITGTEGLSALGFDLVYGGIDVSSTTIAVGPIPASSPDCPEEDIDPPGPPTPGECYLTALTQPNPGAHRFNLATTGLGPTGGTYSIAYQVIQAGTWDGTADIANLVAFDNAGNAITDIVIHPLVPEPATAALLGIGLLGLAIGSRNAKRR